MRFTTRWRATFMVKSFKTAVINWGGGTWKGCGGRTTEITDGRQRSRWSTSCKSPVHFDLENTLQVKRGSNTGQPLWRRNTLPLGTTGVLTCLGLLALGLAQQQSEQPQQAGRLHQPLVALRHRGTPLRNVHFRPSALSNGASVRTVRTGVQVTG